MAADISKDSHVCPDGMLDIWRCLAVSTSRYDALVTSLLPRSGEGRRVFVFQMVQLLGSLVMLNELDMRKEWKEVWRQT